jgi:hypothetical protein
MNKFIISLMTAIVFCFCFCLPFAGAQQKFDVPTYSLEGSFTRNVNFFVRFYEWTDKQWVKIADNVPKGAQKPQSEKPILERHVYHIDRNKDSKMDLVYIENHFPPGFFKKSDPAYKAVVLSIDDNFDCVPDRWLVDGGGEFGPADGIYDVETKLGDNPSHVREREYWKEYCK